MKRPTCSECGTPLCAFCGRPPQHAPGLSGQMKWRVAANGLLYCDVCQGLIDNIVIWQRVARIPQRHLILEQVDQDLRGGVE